MPICHDKRVIFIHIPKTGGSAVTKAMGLDRENPEHLSQNNYKDSIFFEDRWWLPLHLPARAIKELYPEEYENYHKFTVIRNPYYRLLSAYFDKVKLDCPYSIIFDNLNPDHFGEWVWGIKEGLIDNEHVRLQSDYFNLEETEIIRYDYIKKAWAIFAESYNFTITLPRENTSDLEKPTSEYFCEIYPETIRLINEIYDKDFEILKYRKLF